MPPQQHAISGNEPSWFGELAVDGHEIGPDEAIPINENADRPGTAKDRPIANLRKPKATILMPNMDQPQTWHPGLHQLARRRTRAVVGNKHFEVTILLGCKRSQHCVERIFAIEGGNDDGNEFSHAGASQARLSYSDNSCLRRWRQPTGTLRLRQEIHREARRRERTRTIRDQFLSRTRHA